VSGASERVNGGANGPVLYASISYHLNPLCAAAGTGNKPKEFFHHRWIEGVSDRFILNPDFRPPPQLNQETLLASGGASINDFRPLGTPERYCADSRALTKTCDPVPLLYFRSRNPHRFNAGTYQDNANQDNNDISNLEVNQ